MDHKQIFINLIKGLYLDMFRGVASKNLISIEKDTESYIYIGKNCMSLKYYITNEHEKGHVRIKYLRNGSESSLQTASLNTYRSPTSNCQVCSVSGINNIADFIKYGTSSDEEKLQALQVISHSKPLGIIEATGSYADTIFSFYDKRIVSKNVYTSTNGSTISHAVIRFVLDDEYPMTFRQYTEDNRIDFEKEIIPNTIQEGWNFMRYHLTIKQIKDFLYEEKQESPRRRDRFLKENGKDAAKLS